MLGMVFASLNETKGPFFVPSGVVAKREVLSNDIVAVYAKNERGKIVNVWGGA